MRSFTVLKHNKKKLRQGLGIPDKENGDHPVIKH